jgi:hypothetical protein
VHFSDRKTKEQLLGIIAETQKEIQKGLADLMKQTTT